jgi:predicted aminopeptidase
MTQPNTILYTFMIPQIAADTEVEVTRCFLFVSCMQRRNLYIVRASVSAASQKRTTGKRLT